MRRFFQHPLKGKSFRENGSTMVIVVGLVIIISIVLATAIHWNANLLVMQSFFQLSNVQNIEHKNVDRIIDCIVRRRLYDNSTNILENIENLINDNLTHSMRDGYDSVGFELVETAANPVSPVLPTVPDWMATNVNIRSSNPDPNPVNPLFYLNHVSYPDPSDVNDDLDISYQLWFWESVNAGNTNEAIKLPVPPDESAAINDESRFYKKSLHLREVPSSQVQLIAIDEFDTSKIRKSVKINKATFDADGDNNDDEVPGIAFFPFGLKADSTTHGGSLNISSLSFLVSNTDWGTQPSIVIPDESNKIIRHGMAVSWMIDPYTLPEASNNPQNNIGDQKYYDKNYGGSTEVNFDGYELSTMLPGFSVSDAYGGVKRVVIDLHSLPRDDASYYVNCTTPQAKQKGIVVIGAQGVDRQVNAVLTNGALRLEGEQTATPLIVGTSYGGVSFSNYDGITFSNGSTPIWNAYIVNPGRQNIQLFSSGSAGSGSIGLGNAGMNFDTIQIKGTTASNSGLKVGFGTSSSLNVCFLEFNDASSRLVVYKGGVETNARTFSGFSGNIDFEMTYLRTINSIRVRVTGDSFIDVDVSLDQHLSRLETISAVWEGTITDAEINACAGGSAFYKDRNMTFNSVSIRGGIMVGHTITNTIPLEISPSDDFSNGYLLKLSDRFLLFDP